MAITSLLHVVIIACSVSYSWQYVVPCNPNGCYDGESQDYVGTWSVTKSGRECRMWGKDYSKKYENFCRDPDNEGQLWCFTTDPKKDREPCAIPKCKTFNLPDDPCMECTCNQDNGGYKCTGPTCPALACSKERVTTLKGQCCPVCSGPDCFDKKSKTGYSIGDVVPTKNNCEHCVCAGENDIICAVTDCMECPGKLIKDGSCCGFCNTSVCFKGKKTYKVGETVPTRDKCEVCTCMAYNDVASIQCAHYDCAPCQPGYTHVDDDTCCGKCVTKLCVDDKGREYMAGEEIKTKDPCERCTCEIIDGEPETICSMMACAFMCEPGYTHKNDGSCCGACVQDYCKAKDGKKYDYGESVPTKDPCESCMCVEGESGLEILCAMMLCDACPPGFKNINPGKTCCGECIRESCKGDDGKTYEIGQEIPTSDPCETCYCEMIDGKLDEVCQAMMCMFLCDEGFIHYNDGSSCCGTCIPKPTPIIVSTTTLSGPISRDPCEGVRCAKLNCKGDEIYQPKGECCGECKCKLKKKQYVNPGPFGSICDGCVCSNGVVTCNAPSCPDQNLECVKPVKKEKPETVEDCCYSCPNGRTCMQYKDKSKTEIRYGEYQTIGSNVCTCAGDPWYPYAFCAPAKVKMSSFKPFEDNMAPFMQP